MYYKVPINDGVLDIDYNFLEHGVGVSQTEAYVKLREGYTIRPSWQSITEEEWLLAQSNPEPEQSPTLEEKVDVLGVMMVQLMLK